MREKGIVSAAIREEERQFEAAMRPKRLADFTGQPKLKENLAIAIEAARLRGEPLDHVLLYGPPGLGKTTLATIIANEMEAAFQQTSGPILQKKLDLTGILTTISEKQVFFIDEIHRLLPDLEEILYSALEDFHVDLVIGQGPGARTHKMPLKRFTTVGATTRLGLLAAPLRARFGLVLRLNPYEIADLYSIVLRSAHLLDVSIDDNAAEEVARRSRGTPRIANRLLRRVRDYAQVRAAGHIGLGEATTALDMLEVDRFGLDEVDQKIMLTVLEKYSGGPVGLNTIAASIDEEAATIEEVYEPYLMQLGFLDRTPRGRCATDRAFEYFKIRNARPRAGSTGCSDPVKRVYLSLGSNVGDREAQLRLAIGRLQGKQITVLRLSSVYETEPVGFTKQADFLNLIVEADTSLMPMQLLQRTNRIEQELGRQRNIKQGPRTIDIDVLLFGSAVIDTPRLQIPHPRMTARRFVLQPLAELAPGLRHPVTHQTMRELLQAVPNLLVIRTPIQIDVPRSSAEHGT
ncbi:MAG: Holliday junction branch migration DNA helicase RuvB [Bryobacteraceae bacterium]